MLNKTRVGCIIGNAQLERVKKKMQCTVGNCIHSLGKIGDLWKLLAKHWKQHRNKKIISIAKFYFMMHTIKNKKLKITASKPCTLFHILVLNIKFEIQSTRSQYRNKGLSVTDFK